MSETNLSTAQRRVVAHPPDAGHLLVLAGPGSGKTLTIVERIHYLLRHGHCEPENVLAMTFTLQAAGVLRDRLADRGHAGVTAGTFHHVCARYLTDHGAAIGLIPHHPHLVGTQRGAPSSPAPPHLHPCGPPTDPAQTHL